MKAMTAIAALSLCLCAVADGPYVATSIATPSASVRPVQAHPQPVKVVPAPVVVHVPVAVTCNNSRNNRQRVWVPGRYVDQTLPNGQMVRLWIPGHYM